MVYRNMLKSGRPTLNKCISMRVHFSDCETYVDIAIRCACIQILAQDREGKYINTLMTPIMDVI
jgi:hypothetical protein